jgi:hypothetical protein
MQKFSNSLVNDNEDDSIEEEINYEEKFDNIEITEEENDEFIESISKKILKLNFK